MLLLLIICRRKQLQKEADSCAQKKKKRRWWVKPVNRNREKYGEFRRVMLELKLNVKEWYFTYTRMSPSLFESLLAIVGPSLVKKSIRTPLSPCQRLIITLR